MLKVGLTGGIATGKSTVKNIFKDLGAYVIDADEVVKNLWQEKEIIQQAKEILEINPVDKNGNLKTKEIASIIFNNPQKKKELEQLFHPEVFKRIQLFFKEVEKKDKNAVAVAEVPLMIETGSYKNYDVVALVYAPKDVQIKRLLQKGYSEKEAQERLSSQMDIEEKKKYADIVIHNTKDLQHLKQEVKDVYERLKKMAHS